MGDQQLAERVAAGDGPGAAEWVARHLGEGTPLAEVCTSLVCAMSPGLDLCASLPLPLRTLDVVATAVRVAPRVGPRSAALVLSRAAALLAEAPHLTSDPVIPQAPKVAPTDDVESFAGAVRRGEVGLASSVLSPLIHHEKRHLQLGRALVAATAGDAFHGGEKLLTAFGAWFLSRTLSAPECETLVRQVLPWLASEPRDLTPGRAMEDVKAGRTLAHLEPEGFDPRWLAGLLKGLGQSQLKISVPRLVDLRTFKALLGGVQLPEVAPPEHLHHVQRLLVRSLANIEGLQRQLYTALRSGDRTLATGLVLEVAGDGKGYGRVLRICSLVGAERMMVRRYQWGFGMAQDLRLCQASALLADGLGVGAALPAVWLGAWVAGRGGGGLDLPAPAQLSPLRTLQKDRQALLEGLHATTGEGDTAEAWTHLSTLMAGPTPVSRIGRVLVEQAALRHDEQALPLSYVQACVDLAEHLPRPDAEVVLAAAVAYLTATATNRPEPYLEDLMGRYLAGR